MNTSTESITPSMDMAQRLRPSESQISLAQRLMSGRLAPSYVLVALAMPGKRRGVWVTGQEVVDVPGFWPPFTTVRWMG
jgi:hypothetical protein